ncbi:MAG: acyltransferase family protein [Sedimentisphaerales bacterium]|nr:acyltransferase family protein [Sedimentisphaerales bacterium]
MGETKRLYFLDNLRIGLTILVIAHHVGQAYGPTGGSWPIQEPARAAILGPFFTVNRSFFMSLFFLISGYLMVMSYDRNRPGTFIKSRLLRLGVPLVLFFVLVIPLQQYLCHCRTGDLGGMGFWTYYTVHYFGGGERPANWNGPAWPEMTFGHLWYVEHLLIFSLCYAALRLVWRRRPRESPTVARTPGHLTIVLFALALAVASGTVRIWHPIDKWIGFLGFIQVAFADVPRDLSFFIVGAIAYRRGWFLSVSKTMGWVWLSIGVTLAVLWYVFSLGKLWPVFHITRASMWFIYPVWEALLCCGICLGSLVLFRERLNFQGRVGRALAENQYAAYLFHVPVVVSLQALVVAYAWSPFAKFALVTAVGVVLTFLLSAVIRTPAPVRKIL